MMKLIIRILIFVFLLLVTLMFGIHIYLNIQGRFLLIDKLKSYFHRQVTVSSVKTRLPFDLIIKNLEIKGVAKTDKIIASGGVFNIFSGNVTLSKLTIEHAVINIEKPLKVKPAAENNSSLSPVVPAAGIAEIVSNPIQVETLQEVVKIPPVSIKRVVITDSVLNFVDHNIADQGIKVSVKNIEARFENLNLPVTGSQITSFEFKGRIPWENMSEAGKINLKGWINLFEKNMEASLKVEDIDGIHLYPYYSSWVDLDKSRVEQAKLNFSSEIHGLNNEVIANCHLELTRIDFKPRKEEEAQNRAEKITQVVLEIFKSLNQGKIVLDFKFKTKMDSPEFGLAPIIRLAVQDKIKEARKGKSLKPESVITVPGNIVKGTVTTAGELTKSLIDTVFGIGKELKKAFESSFKKEDNVLIVNQTVNQTK